MIKALFYGGKMSIPDHDPAMPFTGKGCGFAITIALGFFAIFGLAIFGLVKILGG